MKASTLVVDTSVAVKWFIPESGAARALQLLEEISSKRTIVLAPDIIHAELSNALWKRVAFGGMDSALAGAMLAAFQELPLESVPCESLATQAFELACRHRRSVYDCLFLSLSLAADAPLVTADEAFYKAVRPSFPKVTWLG